MSQSLEKKVYSGWSEPILQCKNKVNFVQTSDDNIISSVRRSRSISPKLHISKNLTNTFNNKLNGSCMRCGNNVLSTKKKLSKFNKIFINIDNTEKKKQHLRESIKLQLINCQVNESLADDRLTTLIQHLDLITNTLDALIRHIQSLQLSHQSCCRVIDLGQQLHLSPLSSNFSITITDVTPIFNQNKYSRDKRVQQLMEILNICMKVRHVPTFNERFRSLINSYKIRHDNFLLATKNFQCLLNNTKLNCLQLEKLNKQYNSILHEYQHRRDTVNVELPILIKMRLNALQNGFQLLNKFHNNYDYLNNTGDVLKLIGDCLFDDNSSKEMIMEKTALQLSQLEICRRCKINPV